MKTDIAHTNVQHLQENYKSVSTKRGTILKGNAHIMKTGNRYRGKGIRLLLFFSKCHTRCCFGVISNVKSRKSALPYPPPLLPYLHPAMTVFYFLNSLSVLQIQAHTNIFLRFIYIYIPPFFGVIYVPPPQTPPSIFGLDLPNTNPCLSSV